MTNFEGFKVALGAPITFRGAAVVPKYLMGRNRVTGEWDELAIHTGGETIDAAHPEVLRFLAEVVPVEQDRVAG